MAHAFDSFRGMAPPQSEDGEQYRAGKYDIGGPKMFIDLMDASGVPRDAYRVWAAFIPECFRDVSDAVRFAFAILDVDHYRATVDGLEWLAPRISPGEYLHSMTISSHVHCSRPMQSRNSSLRSHPLTALRNSINSSSWASAEAREREASFAQVHAGARTNADNTDATA